MKQLLFTEVLNLVKMMILQGEIKCAVKELSYNGMLSSEFIDALKTSGLMGDIK